MKRFRHWLAHRIHWNEGEVVSYLLDNGYVIIGFECHGCGRVSGLHRVPESVWSR